MRTVSRTAEIERFCKTFVFAVCAMLVLGAVLVTCAQSTGASEWNIEYCHAEARLLQEIDEEVRGKNHLTPFDFESAMRDSGVVPEELYSKVMEYVVLYYNTIQLPWMPHDPGRLTIDQLVDESVGACVANIMLDAVDEAEENKEKLLQQGYY